MSKVAVRFCSKTKAGNTKRIATAIAEGANVEAVSISDEPVLSEKVDVLFLGGAPYANIMAPELRKYAEALDKEMVGKVVLFSTSNWSRRTVKALKKMLKEKGIDVAGKYFYAHVFNIEGKLSAARAFGEKVR
ncbi:MAG: hypothetical protein J6X48_11260 [Lachnospiraceae bacterium]|nr:hypothetical protein [Lachnospiraceae bacterium]